MFTNPYLTFTFNEGLESEVTIPCYNIIKDSLTFDEQLQKELRSSSNQVTVTLKREPLYIAGVPTLTCRILQSERDIKAKVYDNGTLLFTGYVSNSKSWNVSNAGLNDFTLRLEDIGVRRLKAVFSKTDTIVKGNINKVIGDVCSKANIEYDQNADQFEDEEEVIAKISAGTTCQDVLSTLMYEIGHLYYFNINGKLSWKPINLNPDSASVVKLTAAQAADSDGLLRTNKGEAISLSRRISDYKQASVEFTTLETAEEINLYKATDLTVAAGSYWDGESHPAALIPDTSKWPVLTETSTPEDDSTPHFIELRNLNDEVRGIRLSWTQKCKKGMPLCTNGAVHMYFTTTNDHNAWGNRLGPDFEFELDREWGVDSVTGSFDDQLVALSSNHTMSEARYLAVGNAATFTTSSVSNLRITGAYKELSDDAIIADGSVEAVNLNNSKELWYIYPENFTTVTTQTGGEAVANKRLYLKEGTLNLGVFIDNSNNQDSTASFSEWSAKGKCLLTKAEGNFVYANGTNVQPTLSGETTFNYQCKFIHDITRATSLVSNLGRYYAFCQNTYSFRSSYELQTGSVVEIEDNLFTGLDIKVVITNKQVSVKPNQTPVFTYSGYALSDIGSVDLRSSINSSSEVKYAASQFRFRGEWDATLQYYHNSTFVDVVYHNGSSWIAEVDNINQEPSDSSAYWSLMSASGDGGVGYVYYGLSTSPTTCTVPDTGWKANINDEYRHNLYIWSRQAYFAVGSDTPEWSVPYYDEVMTNVYKNQVSVSFVPISATYSINHRSTSEDGNIIQIELINKGWAIADWRWTVEPADSTISFDSTDLILTIGENTEVTNGVTLIVQGLDSVGDPIEGCSYAYKFKAINTTNLNAYCGTSEEPLPTTTLQGTPLYEGDYCINISDHCEPYIWRGGEWIKLPDDDPDYDKVLSGSMTDALEILQDDMEELTASRWAFFNNLVANNVTAETISATTIERGYKEDSNGAPISGYKLDANTSQFKCGSAVLGNCTLRGDNATIDSPALTTNNASSGSSSISGSNSGNTTYYDYTQTFNSLPTANNWVSASGTYNGVGVTRYRATSATRLQVASRTNIGYGDFSWAFTVPANGTYSMEFQGTKSYTRNFFVLLGIMKMWSTAGCSIWDETEGKEVAGVNRSANEEGVRSFNAYLYKNHSYTVRWRTTQFDEHITEGYFYLYDNFGAKGFACSDGVFLSPISSPRWRSESITNLVVNGTTITPNVAYTYEDDMSIGGTKTLEGTLSGFTSSSSVNINGTSYTGYAGVNWTSDGVFFNWADGSSQSILKGNYYSSFSWTGNTSPKAGRIDAVDIFPKTVGGYDLGSQTERWGSIYLINEPNWSSRREMKKDIEDFEELALPTILSTDIKTFRMKTDSDDAPKRLGFIANDTNHWMSSEHQGVSTSGCIGMLVKAIQELQEEINELKKEK